MNEIEELKKQMAEMQEKIEKLESKKEKRWRAEKGKTYSSMETEVFSHIEDRDNVDKLLYNIGNYFKNEEDTKKVKKYLEIRMKLIELANKLNTGEEIDWNNEDQEKYYLTYNEGYKYICQISEDFNHQASIIYCLNKLWKEKAINEIGKEDLQFYLTFDWDEIYF